ncbi:MAG: hypothetical protein DRI89_11980, partial [Bacteroidetes bacterium]
FLLQIQQNVYAKLLTTSTCFIYICERKIIYKPARNPQVTLGIFYWIKKLRGNEKPPLKIYEHNANYVHSKFRKEAVAKIR